MSVQRKYKSGAQKRKERKLKAVPPANNRISLLLVRAMKILMKWRNLWKDSFPVNAVISESAACSLEDENCTQNDSHEDNENNEDILEGSDYHEPETQINFMDDCDNDSSCIANHQWDIGNLPVLLSPSVVETAVRSKVSSFPEELPKIRIMQNFLNQFYNAVSIMEISMIEIGLFGVHQKRQFFVFLVAL